MNNSKVTIIINNDNHEEYMIDIDYLHYKSRYVWKLETPKIDLKHIVRDEKAHKNIVQHRNFYYNGRVKI